MIKGLLDYVGLKSLHHLLMLTSYEAVIVPVPIKSGNACARPCGDEGSRGSRSERHNEEGVLASLILLKSMTISSFTLSELSK